MLFSSSLDPEVVKQESELVILTMGGKICAALPPLDRPFARDPVEVIGRALVMSALIQIWYKAPIPVVSDWIIYNKVDSYVTAAEENLLLKKNSELTRKETADLFWYTEGLWALMWVGGLLDEMRFDGPVDHAMSILAPNLQDRDSSSLFLSMQVKSHPEIFKMLDLYYRLHWFARHGQIHGYSTEPIQVDIVMERRRALEWVLQPGKAWDEVDLSLPVVEDDGRTPS